MLAGWSTSVLLAALPLQSLPLQYSLLPPLSAALVTVTDKSTMDKK
jgi:hypothetical protein